MAHKGRYTLKFADGRTTSLALSGKALNRGADGVIYRSPDARYALKYYHEPDKYPARQHKVWQMVLNPPEDARAEHFAWPKALILNTQGTFVGFAMPLLDVPSYASLDMALSARGRHMESLPQRSAWRLRVAVNLAKRVAELHAKGHCIIDLKPANLLVHRKSGDVAVVDCDGFAVQGNNEYFPAHQFTAGFIAPEAFRTQQTPQDLRQEQDAFAMAVILFKLLNGGLHPYQGIPTARRNIPSDNQNRIAGGYYPYGLQENPDIKPSPWSIHRDFPHILRETFDRSFEQQQRPSAQEWVALLEQSENSLKTCARDRDHAYWSQQCPHCERTKTRVQVQKPKPSPPAVPATPAKVMQTPIQTSLPQPAHAASTSGAGVWIILLIYLVAILAMTIADGRSKSRGYSSPASTPKSTPYTPIDTQPRTWRDRGPVLSTLYALNRSATYRTRSTHALTSSTQDKVGEPIPFYRFGAFDQPESLSLLRSTPMNTQFLGLAQQSFSLSQLDMLSGEITNVAQHNKLTAPYGMEFWQTDPRPGRSGIYLPQCAANNCDLLQRLEPGRPPLNYKLPEWQGRDPFDHYPLWHYRISPEGNFLVMASAQQVAVFAVDRPQKPLALLDLPKQLSSYSLDSLSVNADAGTLVLGLSKQERFGVNFTAALLELTRNGTRLTLNEGFAERARAAGSELLSSYQTLSRDGQTLAVSEYQQVETNSTDYTWLMQPVTVALGYPAISIWRRDSDGQWQLRQRIEWQGLRGSSKLQISRPRQMSLFTGLDFNMSQYKIIGEGQPHQELQLTADGSRLLSGLETEEHNGLTANSYLFDIRGNEPALLGRITIHLRQSGIGLKAAYPSVRLSDSGRHAVMGWFMHHESSNHLILDQSLRIEVFALPDVALPDQPTSFSAPLAAQQP